VRDGVNGGKGQGVFGQMRFTKLLKRRKSDILAKWFDLVVSTYPPDTMRFLKSQRDPFANPVGQTTRTSLETLLALLMGDPTPRQLVEALDPIIRIRAVQQFTASNATGFAFGLKGVLKEQFKTDLKDDSLFREFCVFCDRIDQMGLAAFDAYMQCREKISTLKVATERDRFYSAFSRAGLIKEEPADKPDSDGS
jgi:hypothetical protein